MIRCLLNKKRSISVFFFMIGILLHVNILAQSEKSTLAQIEELKLQPAFSFEDPAYIDLLNTLAKKYIYINPDSTKILLSETYDLSLKSNYKKGESRSLLLLGHYYSERGQKDKAYESNMKALDIANMHHLKKEKVDVLNNVGIDYWEVGNNANALSQYLEALQIAEEIEYTYMMSVLNDNIALIYRDNDDLETALAFHEKSKKISLKYKNEKLLARTLVNMGLIYVKKNDVETASLMVGKSIQYFKKENILSWLSYCYEVKGKISFKLNNYEAAISWYSKSERLCNEIDYNVGYAQTYNGLAESYLALNNLKAAEEYSLKALEKSKGLNNVAIQQDVNYNLATIYHKLGQDTKAYEYQKSYTELFEKIIKNNHAVSIGILKSEMKFENQKKKLIEENNKAIAEQKRYVYFAIAALILVTMFLCFIYRTNKLQKRFNTELQIKQDALILHEAELNNSNNTKDKLFSVVAHDLRGPINSFYSLMKLYVDKGFSKEEADFIFPKALKEIHGISDLLNNLLLWAKAQMTGIEINPEKIDINELINDNKLLLSPLADKKTIKITNNISSETFIYSDRDHMNIVLRNLISNAIKFTNLNGVIHINAIELDKKLQIEVKDNGVGMDLETQSKLFENDSNASTFGTNNEKGTGLGLSLCKDMIESNGGKISVSSVKGEGTSIFFTIPLNAPIKAAV